MLRKSMLAAIVALLPAAASAATVDVVDADISPSSNVVWTADNEYLLNGLVFVDEGATLTIQPGTVIKGMPGQGENASALVVARGGKIFASGTPDQPIVFTAQADDVSDAGDLPLDARGLWGGVGSGTLIEFVEVYNNQDDGFEWFGGTVNTKNLVSAFNGDDAFDYDEGFRGKGQFWFVVQDDETGNRAGEHDGGTTPEDGTPFAMPQIYNVTYIGSGAFSANGDNDVVLKIRDNAGGMYINSIFTDFAGEAVDIEDLESGEDSRARLEAGDLRLANNIWWGFGAGEDLASIAPDQFVADYLAANDNRIADPLLIGISRDRDRGLDPRPQADSPAWTGMATTPEDGFYSQVDYVGAFGRSLWTSGWTFLSEAGIMPTEAATFVAEESAVQAALPDGYALEQNIPNPFNPSTTINYSVPADGHVKLTVYNSVGQEMATLVNDARAAGTYAVSLDAADYSTGIYFYRLEADGQTLMRKMTLLK